tara:strand:+ start:1612 stop:1827 length:216 start_codon:yes stop_codon:yes gene_type:complete
MKKWYKAVCDEHKEMIDVFVDTPSSTAFYLSEKDQQIYEWLGKHTNCRLRFIWQDRHLDECFEWGYRSISK